MGLLSQIPTAVFYKNYPARFKGQGSDQPSFQDLAVQSLRLCFGAWIHGDADLFRGLGVKDRKFRLNAKVEVALQTLEKEQSVGVSQLEP